jgi:TolB protein
VVAVVAGVTLGYRELNRRFAPLAPPSGGVIVFQRLLRACPGVPQVGESLDAFAIAPDGATQWRLSPAPSTSVEPFWQEDPALSPDGRTLAFTDHYRDGLWLSDLRTGEARRLVEGLVGSFAWAPDGRSVAFDRGATVRSGIWTVPTEGGPPTVLADSGYLPRYAPDGSTIAYLNAAPSDMTASLWFMNADGTEQRAEAIQPPDRDFRVEDGEWSPDGSRFVAEVHTPDNVDLYVVDIHDLTGYRLTDDPADDTSPTWSPDGQWIAFSTGRWSGGPGHSEIALVPAAGGAVTRLTHDCWDDFAPSWASADGIVRSLEPWSVPPVPDLGPSGTASQGDILYTADVQGVVDVWATRAEGGGGVNVTADLPEQDFPAWSPDRTKVAVTTYAGPSSPKTGTTVMDADGSHRRVVVPGGGRASWSPEGTRLAVELQGGLVVVDLATLERSTLTHGPHDDYPAWSPDGRTVAFSRGGSLALVDVATGRVTIVVPGRANVEPDWSPDGRWLAYTSEGRAIGIVAPDGSGARVLAVGSGETLERTPAWSPDGARIAFLTDVAPPGERADSLWLCTVDRGGSDVRWVSGVRSVRLGGLDW